MQAQVRSYQQPASFLFSQEIEDWSSDELQEILEASQGQHSAFWEARLQVVREELAARIAYQL
ncbi:hypothetical protein A6M27_12540 [Acidithiobacillus thiooxidans]|uniref:hypothetical protein n=1 Tax=Acidithiobacillus thiooxidans TaxID=930 RepID=UPI000467130A|nr:hypothetical protein [Acidithiobacillus thiooxidans]OCX69543.1 hypothetical protein A6O24_18280 [Acidithiobacillus thiooxidans]OCX83518.1 hypothetical protein A6O26_06845 [Acidithiobacillus thiooxidans]OCX86479.1 hypothetical protein A6M27_12540 [Acidithiobacillus thiooxidans]OFC48712.1 hypothetical protein BAE47_06735 [Acidithiobacillus thiooxidans]